MITYKPSDDLSTSIYSKLPLAPKVVKDLIYISEFNPGINDLLSNVSLILLSEVYKYQQ